MHQALTHREENIIVPWKQVQIPTELLALPHQPSNVTFNVASPRIAMAPIAFNEQAVMEKPNATRPIVPFEANFEDEGVPDFDFVSILDEVENSQKTENQTSSTAMVSTNQVINKIPKSLFHNCTIQNFFFFKKFCLDQGPFCGATDCSCFGLCVSFLMGFKSRVDVLPALFLACML